MSDTLTSERIDHLCHVDEQGLLADSIPFWLKHGLDREFGGIMASLDRDGAVLDTDKGVWQQGRFAWMLGYLYNTVERRPDWLAAAESTLRFIEAHCFDADGYGLMNMTGVTAGSLVTSLLGKSADAGRLGRDIALLAIPVALAVVLQLMVLKPVSADKQDE